MKKIVISVVAILMSASVYAQKTGKVGGKEYPILGTYTGKCSLGSYSFASGSDSVYFYSKIVNDSLLYTQELYKKGVIVEVNNIRIKYKHQNINIVKPELFFRGEYKVVLEAKNNDESSNIRTTYSERGISNYSSGFMRAHIFFPNKEVAEKFYNNLMSGTSTETNSQPTAASQTTVAKVEVEVVKIMIKNTGSAVAEMYYEETPGSRNLKSFRVQKGQSDDLKIGVGCSLYYNVKGGKGALILTATKALNGTTKIVQ
jgi:hypothetical protein